LQARLNPPANEARTQPHSKGAAVIEERLLQTPAPGGTNRAPAARRWLLNCWQVAAYGRELTTTPLARTLCEREVVLFRPQGGAAVAFEDRCPHRGLPLSFGTVVGGELQCGYHGLRFDATGACTRIPGQENIPHGSNARRYPTVERHRFVWIWLGDPAQADPALVPDVHFMDDPGWAVSEGYHYIRAHFMLLCDNLLDLSHETFVHAETIGNRAVADSPATARLVDEREVRVHRYMAECEAPPLYNSANALSGTIDRWHTSIYRPPGYVLIESAAKPSGSTDPAAVTERRIIDLLTPETLTTSHYFWSVARNFALDDARLTEHLRERSQFTFDQDTRVLEAQQRKLGATDDPEFGVTIRLDAGPVLARRLLRSLIEREGAVS